MMFGKVKRYIILSKVSKILNNNIIPKHKFN